MKTEEFIRELEKMGCKKAEKGFEYGFAEDHTGYFYKNFYNNEGYNSSIKAYYSSADGMDLDKICRNWRKVDADYVEKVELLHWRAPYGGIKWVEVRLVAYIPYLSLRQFNENVVYITVYPEDFERFIEDVKEHLHSEVLG